MDTMVINVYAECNYDRLCIDKALGNFENADNNKYKNNMRILSGSKNP